jgi:hypothetical protein
MAEYSIYSYICRHELLLIPEYIKLSHPYLPLRPGRAEKRRKAYRIGTGVVWSPLGEEGW